MFIPVAIVERSGLPESWHFGAAAVVTPTGELAARLGDPGVATFLRSAAKPFQALPLVLALAEAGEDPFGLTDADLALMCGSHAGAPEHVERARSLLARGGFGPGDLRCGAHPPLGPEYARALAAAGEEPGPLHNNCSGKHAGMLLACRQLALPTEGYLEPEHPLQRQIAELLAAFCGLEAAALGRGVDGCSAPTFHLPLTAAARAWGALAAPELTDLPAATAAAATRLVAAMAAAPAMVAGPGRFTTRLAEVTGGRVLGKEGAEGVYCMAVRGPVALGVAFKIADGGERARDAVALELLHRLGCLAGAELAQLAEYHGPRLRNHRGLTVGRIVPDFELAEGELG